MQAFASLLAGRASTAHQVTTFNPRCSAAAPGCTRLHQDCNAPPSLLDHRLAISRKTPSARDAMSFQQSSALESQPTTWRREDDPQYADDPEFRDFASKLGDDIFALTSDVARLSQEIAKLGTSRETARVRERVKTAVEDTSDKMKEIGERLKRLTTWPDVGVRCTFQALECS